MRLHDFFDSDGKKNLNYAKNFKTHKYIKIVTFIGYQQHYVEAIASNNKDNNEDAILQVMEISPTAEIKDVFVFESKHIV